MNEEDKREDAIAPEANGADEVATPDKIAGTPDPGAEEGDGADPFYEMDELDLILLYRSCLIDWRKTWVPATLALVLWIATAWVPYLNIGTTIALFALPVAIAGGGGLDPFDIFSPEHRKGMKRFFLMSGWIGLACTAAAAVCSIGGLAVWSVFRFWSSVQLALLAVSVAVPVCMLATTWSMAPFLLLDKGMLAEDALKMSEEITEGKRLGIFVAFAVPVWIGAFWFRFCATIPYVGWIINFALFLFLSSFSICIAGKIYRKLLPEDGVAEKPQP